MTPKVLSESALPTDELPAMVARKPGWRPMRAVRRRAAWLLLIGWIVLPLLPVIGLGLSVLLGIGLF